MSDRVSARRVLIAGDAVMLVFSLLLAAAAYHLGAPPALLIAAGVVVGLGLTPGVAGAAIAGLVIGVGNGVFSVHIAPLVLAMTPASHLSRVQAVLVLVQSLALLLMNNVLGNLAGLSSPMAAVLVCAVTVVGVGLLGLASGPLRTNRTGLGS